MVKRKTVFRFKVRFDSPPFKGSRQRDFSFETTRRNKLLIGRRIEISIIPRVVREGKIISFNSTRRKSLRGKKNFEVL